MAEGCSHDCSSCGKKCGDRKEEFDFSAKLNPASKVARVIAVASGKGGVGKSFVTTMLAVAAMRQGKKVGILDADITGPSIPKDGGIKVISLNMLVEDPSDPVVWRGPVIAGVVKQFWTDVHGGDLDVIFVDMPPGTGDVPLTVFQSLPVDGVVVVSSPQELVEMIVSKSVKMAGMMGKKVLGLVENMSYLLCPDCGKKIEPFGASKVEALAAKFGIPETLRLPINPDFASSVDGGAAEFIEIPGFDGFAAKII